MAVTTSAGLVGKVTTPLLSDRAYVMLVTDPRYHIAAKVVSATPPESTTTAPPPPAAAAPPAGAPVPPSTAPPAVPPAAPPPSSVPPETTTTVPAPTTTVPLTDPSRRRDTGELSGQGPSSLPQVDLLSATAMLGRIVKGDLIFTAGGNDSLAPPDIPIGTVENVINRSSSEGPLLEVQPSVDLDRLHFVSIIIYRPSSEAGSGPTSQAGGG
jgi:rod shape-determining protein MreC